MITESQIKIAKINSKSLNPELGWIDKRVDRATVLGNPFEIPQDCPPEWLESTRGFVIEGFRRWLWENIKLAQTHPNQRVPLESFKKEGYLVGEKFKNPTAGQVVEKLREFYQLLKAGKKLRLLCWCYPLNCHADIIGSCLINASSNPKLLALIIGSYAES
jgi:hypothetical protein